MEEQPTQTIAQVFALIEQEPWRKDDSTQEITIPWSIVNDIAKECNRVVGQNQELLKEVSDLNAELNEPSSQVLMLMVREKIERQDQKIKEQEEKISRLVCAAHCAQGK